MQKVFFLILFYNRKSLKQYPANFPPPTLSLFWFVLARNYGMNANLVLI